MKLSFSMLLFCLAVALGISSAEVAFKSLSDVAPDGVKNAEADFMLESRRLSDSDEEGEDGSGDSSDEEEGSGDSSDEEEGEEMQEEAQEMAYTAYGAAIGGTFILSSLGLLEWRRRVRVKNADLKVALNENIPSGGVAMV